MMALGFGRAVCGDLVQSERREWIVTNGLGGYASGTIAGTLTRSYHGLLVAPLKPPVDRHLLVSKVDETIIDEDDAYDLFSNRWTSSLIEPRGYLRLERFWLDGGIPVWRYVIGDQWVEKRIWMAQGENRTYCQYKLVDGDRSVQLQAKVLLNPRNHHAVSQPEAISLQFESVAKGVMAPYRDSAVTLQSDRAQFQESNEWYAGYHLSVEAHRGLDSVDAHLLAGTFTGRLGPDDPVTLVFGTTPTAALDGEAALRVRRGHEAHLLGQAHAANRSIFHCDYPESLQQLILAADQFIVSRPSAGQPDGKSVIAGYHWFTDWGRDTMIALPGLTMATGRFTDAEQILRTFASHISQGMIPNRFPDETETPEYNTVDATLWYVEAIRAYLALTRDKALLETLFPKLQRIFAWHVKGTRYGIGMDPADSLLRAGDAGVQLTWMDAKVADWVVTPRIGKPVEINALWYNGLMAMVDFSRQLGYEPEPYREIAQQVQTSFGRYWYEAGGFLYDVLDVPAGGHDSSLRPNQLFAASLHHSPLTAAQKRRVVTICLKTLWTSHGLRSLAPADAAYLGSYGGDRYSRDGAYHQGTTWGWLIGPLVAAHWQAFQDRPKAVALIRPLFDHMSDHGVGTISEIFDGDAPFTPRGCIAQAWSVAELLRVWQLIHEENG